MWLFFSLITATIYRCNLKAMLTMPNMKLPFTTVEEFMQNSDLLAYSIQGSELDHNLKVIICCKI